MKTLTLTIAALAALSPAALAGPAPKAAPAKTPPLICPVTGSKIASAAKAYSSETYHGKTYYFCCPECKPAFDENPAKVIADSAHGKYRPM